MHNHHNALTAQHVLTTQAFFWDSFLHTHARTHTLTNSSVDIVTRLQTGQSWFNVRDFIFSKASRVVLGATPPLIQELLGTLTPRVEQSVWNWPPTCTWKLYFHSPSMPSQCGQGHLYLYFYIYYQCLHPSILTRSFVCHLTLLPRNLVN